MAATRLNECSGHCVATQRDFLRENHDLSLVHKSVKIKLRRRISPLTHHMSLLLIDSADTEAQCCAHRNKMYNVRGRATTMHIAFCNPEISKVETKERESVCECVCVCVCEGERG